MPLEIELKLSLPEPAQQTLLQHPLLEQVAVAAPQQHTLFNGYYDTPDQLLNRHAIALRVRRQGKRFIQTLKTKGISRGGLHERQEWEWELDSATLDPSLLPMEVLPDDLDSSLLAPSFVTDFERTTWQLSYPSACGEATGIELACDAGYAASGDRKERIGEIELELKSGPAEGLFELALALAQELPLRITRTSKAERGYRLQHPERARLPLKPLRLKPDISNGEAFGLLMAHQLECWQQAMEGYEFLRDVALLQETSLALQALNDLIEAFKPLLGDRFDGNARRILTLQQRFDRLLCGHRLQQALGNFSLAAMFDDQTEEALALLSDRELGLLGLELSQLIYCQPWLLDAKQEQRLVAEAPFFSRPP